MKPPSALCGFVLALAMLAGCQTTQVPDLARNSTLFRSTGFVSKVPGDRAAFVAPLQDARHPEVLPASDGGFPITYDSDQRWSRPVTEMIDDVLREELQGSAVFAKLLPAAAPDQLVVMPSLSDFTSGIVELDMGARTEAEVGIRVQVFGPADASGKRELLHDQIYGDRKVSSGAMMPMSTYVLMGRALSVSMRKLVAGLDGSNVSRSNLPAK